MSTRCQIGFYSSNEAAKVVKNWGALIYRHSDGYPDTEHGVVEALLPFLKWFDKGRGLSDTEYAAARCLQYLCNEYDHDTNISQEHWNGKPLSTLKGRPTAVLGLGISKNFHGDIEYFYAVSPGALEVYEVNGFDDDQTFNRISAVDLKVDLKE